MRLNLCYFAAMVCLLGGPVLAQEQTTVGESRCWLGSVTFSTGASLNVGNGVAICQGDSGWQQAEADASAAGCLLEGELSSVGAVVGISNNDSQSLQCEASGLWAIVAIPTGQ